MADPISATALISMGAAGGGSIISALGSTFQGKSEAAMYNYQAGLAKTNQVLADQDASYAREAGDVQTQEAGMKGRAQFGQTRAAFGASNIAGKSQDQVLGSETAITQENEGLIQADAAKKAYGFEVQAAKDTAQSSVYTSAATTSEEAAQFGVASSIIGGVGNVASKWMQYKSAFGSPTNPTMFGGDAPSSGF